MTDAADWREDPGWKLTWYRADLYSESTAPDKPTAEAELSQPDTWATLYDGACPAAIWWRPSGPRSTVRP